MMYFRVYKGFSPVSVGDTYDRAVEVEKQWRAGQPIDWDQMPKTFSPFRSDD